jgi:ribonuclease HI
VLSTPPILVTPNEKEPLLLYIAATHQVVSTVLVVERSKEGKAHGVQRPVYFLSEVLSLTKQRYPHYQKLAYSVFTTTRKLRQYFRVHPIIVVNEAPLSNILNNPSATGCVSLWGIELSPLDITYEKRKAIKSQVLPDFTAEWLELQNTGPPDLLSVWTIYFDGSKRIQGAGAGVVQISPQGDKLKYILRMSFPQASNNEAEYEALLHGMKMAKACGATRLKIFGDSNLVVQQVMNRCNAISDNMIAYRNLYYYLEGTFDGCEVFTCQQGQQRGSQQLSKYRVPMPACTTGSLLGRDHRKINKKQQNFGYRRAKSALNNGPGGWQRKHNRTRRSYDD